VIVRGFNPVAILIHALGIAAGIFLGLLAMDAIAPDLPAEAEAPGVATSVAPEAVRGDDLDSLFLPNNLGPALTQLHEQIAAGQGILRLRITPGSLEAMTATGDGLIDRPSIPDAAPLRIAQQAEAERAQVTLEDFSYFDLVATPDGPVWYAQLDINITEVNPPWTYTAPLEGEPLLAGRAPPTQVDAEPEQQITPAPVD
jgi:hypothetical protein